MEKLEELLPGLEDFLIALGRENLSSAVEKQREVLLERLEVYKLPPSLPPRPDGLPKFSNGVSTPPLGLHHDDDYIAKLREASRLAQINGVNNLENDLDEEEEDCLYDRVDVSNYPGSCLAQARKEREKLCSITSEENVGDRRLDDELYEMPVIEPDLMVEEARSSDEGSGSGSYESYEEDAVYENQIFDSPRDDIPLPSGSDSDQDSLYEAVDQRPPLKPAKRHSLSFYSKRVRTKVRRKRKSHNGMEDLPNVTHKGELYQKGIFTPVKRYCVISDNKLMCYKSEKDTKPFINFPLLGYDVIYIEKEGKFEHVIKISHPGCEPRWFGADNMDNAKEWIKHLLDAAYMTNVPGLNRGVERTPSNATTNSLAVPHSSADSSSLHGSSEGCSGDGTVGVTSSRSQSPMPPEVATSPLLPVDPETLRKSSSLEKQKKQGGLFGGFFTTFGKKKGDKVKKMLEHSSEDIDMSTVDPEAVIFGYLNIMSSLASNKKWNRRWCTVKKKCFYSHFDQKDSNIEFSLPLTGLNIDLAAMETKRDLAIKLVKNEEDMMYIEAENSLDHGNWLSILIKVTGCADQGEGDLYENQSGLMNNNTEPSADQVYDEVYHHQTGVKRGNASSTSSSFSNQSVSTASSSIPSSRDNSGDTEYLDPRSTPPPLPKTGPPIHRLSSRSSLTRGSPRDGSPRGSTQGSRDGDLGEEYDDVHVGVAINKEVNSTVELQTVEDEVASVFLAAKSKFNEPKTKSPDSGWRVARVSGSPRATTSPAKRSPKDRASRDNRKKTEQVIECQVTEQKPEVVKCHSGPTIAEDAELFKATQNPLLKELKKEKGKKEFTLQDRTKIDQQIEDLEREYESLKKKRGEARSKLLGLRGAGKAQLEEELQGVEEELEARDKELTKLRLLAKEKDAIGLGRNTRTSSSFGKCSKLSPVANRRVSTSPARSSTSSSPVVSRIPSATISTDPKGTNASPLASGRSNLNNTAKPWQNQSSVDKTTTKLATATDRATINATTAVGKTTTSKTTTAIKNTAKTSSVISATYAAKSSTKTVSMTTKRAIARWNTDENDSSSPRLTGSPRSPALKSNPNTRNGTTSSALPRTMRPALSTTTKLGTVTTTGSVQGTAETGVNNGQAILREGDANANNLVKGRNRQVRTVQGTVKLWESLADGSNF